MAAESIFIIDAKIQKQRLNDMKNAARRKKFKILDSYVRDVTYIVTEYKEIEPVLRKLDMSSQDDLGGSEVVSVDWFSASMRAGRFVQVEPLHRIQSVPTEQVSDDRDVATAPGADSNSIADYACQRSTPLNHHNGRFTNALEVLEKHAELRDMDQDYSRALAFRRASCVLKSLPYQLTNIRQLNNVTHVGGHSKRVLQELLEDHECQEVSAILADPWFQKMKLFSGVFGVGPATAKKWIERGWSSIQEAQEENTSSDWRVKWGLAFHEDLITPVTRPEADYIQDIVRRHLNRICHGATMELTGGFRRGKKQGHDVDILITHPKMGRETGCLVRLLQSLQSCDFIVCGNHEIGTYSDEVLVRDFKLSAKGQLDHFEKWLGIVKVPKSVHEKCAANDGDEEVVYERTKPGQKSGKVQDNQDECSADDTDKTHKRDEKSKSGVDDKHVEATECNENIDATNTVNDDSENLNGSIDEFKAQAKVQRQCGNTEKSLLEQSKEPRDWIARRVDLIISPYDQYFYALVGWTGNKQFNRDLRTYAPKIKNMKLTSHGLYDLVKGVKIPANSEKEVFDNLGLTYREPWQRNC